MASNVFSSLYFGLVFQVLFVKHSNIDNQHPLLPCSLEYAQMVKIILKEC